MKNFATLFLLFISFYTTAQPQFAKMNEALRAGNYENIHSILISQNDTIIYEAYFNGYNRDSLHDSRSSFKSITSLLTGIALDKQLIKNVKQPISTFFPAENIFAADTLKKQITIENLLEMRSGFDCNEWDDSKDCEAEMEKTSDWVNFSLSIPMKNKPGTTWAYTSCNPVIVGGIIEKAANMPVIQFADTYFFAPLGITKYRWTTDPSGHGMTGGSFYIRPVDMLQIGQLVLNNGKKGNTRIVSEKWLENSTRCNIPIPGSSFVQMSRSAAAIPQPAYYGYYWYREEIKTASGSYPLLFASGNGGQYIMIIKPLNMVVVFTQGNYGKRVAKQAFDILAKYILPSE
ncbi:MAG: serine hydrolase [Filimonas sp.]|nr:serine hydrolase [Filimonas sp.]